MIFELCCLKIRGFSADYSWKSLLENICSAVHLIRCLLIIGSVTALGGANTNPPEAVTLNATTG